MMLIVIQSVKADYRELIKQGFDALMSIAQFVDKFLIFRTSEVPRARKHL